METVHAVSPVNVSIYSDYILPKLSVFVSLDGAGKRQYDSLIRATYGLYLASLAETSLRFVDMAQSFRADKSLSFIDPETEEHAHLENFNSVFDVSKNDLIAHFEVQATALMTDNDAAVKRAFLPSVTRLCVLFGRSKANDVLLSHLNTYLNDKNWVLKSAFFDTIVGVATYVGPTSLNEYILPLMTQALAGNAISLFSIRMGINIYKIPKSMLLKERLVR